MLPINMKYVKCPASHNNQTNVRLEQGKKRKKKKKKTLLVLLVDRGSPQLLPFPNTSLRFSGVWRLAVRVSTASFALLKVGSALALWVRYSSCILDRIACVKSHGGSVDMEAVTVHLLRFLVYWVQITVCGHSWTTVHLLHVGMFPIILYVDVDLGWALG
jgi:hypothetical protein